MGNHISLFPPQRNRLCEERGGAEKNYRRKRQVVQGAAGELAEQGKTPAQEKKMLPRHSRVARDTNMNFYCFVHR